MQKLCIECGVPFKGRSDKKFCSDYCRNHYNNKLNSYANNFERRINAILRKNRRILANRYPDGHSCLNKNDLLWEGFNFRYITHFSKSDKGDTIYFCYDYGYILINEDSCMLVNKSVKG